MENNEGHQKGKKKEYNPDEDELLFSSQYPPPADHPSAVPWYNYYNSTTPAQWAQDGRPVPYSHPWAGSFPPEPELHLPAWKLPKPKPKPFWERIQQHEPEPQPEPQPEPETEPEPAPEPEPEPEAPVAPGNAPPPVEADDSGAAVSTEHQKPTSHQKRLRKWTAEEDAELRRRRENDESYEDIGRALNRTANGCETRGKKLGIYKGGQKR